MPSNPGRIEPGSFDVDFANAFLLTNCFDLVSDLVPETDPVRDRLDEHERRRSGRSVELDSFGTAQSIDKRLVGRDVFHPIQLERIGHLAKNARARLQSFAG